MEKSLHIYEDKKYKMEKTTYISLIVFFLLLSKSQIH